MVNRLQKLRWSKNWSQVFLSKKSGVSQSIIAEIETNSTQNPTVQTALRLAKALNVSVEDIFMLEE